MKKWLEKHFTGLWGLHYQLMDKTGKFKENSVLRLLDYNLDEMYTMCKMWNTPWYHIHHPENHMCPDEHKLHGILITNYKLYF